MVIRNSLRRMRFFTFIKYFLLSQFFIIALPSQATTILMQTLDDMAASANDIFRGELISVKPTEIAFKGQSIQATQYVFQVHEMLKGQVNRDNQQFEFTMIGSIEGKNNLHLDNAGFPRLEHGGEYLLLMQKPSKIGLSSPIGLANGSFKIFTVNKKEMVVNGFNNIGLYDKNNKNKLLEFNDSNQDAGLITYDTIKNTILSAE